MRFFPLCLIVCLPAAAQTNQDTLSFTTHAGVVVSNATVLKVEGDKVVYVFSDGGGTVPLAELPPEIRARYAQKPGTAPAPAETVPASLAPIQALADQGNASAMAALGDAYALKWQKDFATSLTARAGLPPDPHTGLPVGTARGTNNVNYLKSMEWYEKAASLGDTNAMWKIISEADASESRGSFVDPATGIHAFMTERGLRWLQKLATAGNPKAAKTLAAYNSSAAAVRPDLEVLDLRAKAMQNTATAWQWSYQLKLKNNTAKPVDQSHNVLFLDAEGFVIAKSPCDIKLSASETKTFLDTVTISLPGGGGVKSVKFE
jgi:hypothetical protein